MANSNQSLTAKFFSRGEPMVWLSGLGLGVILLMVITLLGIIVSNAVVVFWPRNLVTATVISTDQKGQVSLGELVGREESILYGNKLQLKVGNRDLYGADFRWLAEADVKLEEAPRDAYVVERTEFGNFYGYWQGLEGSLATKNPQISLVDSLIEIRRQNKQLERLRNQIEAISQKISSLQKESKKTYFDQHGHTRGHDPQALALTGELRQSYDEQIQAVQALETEIKNNRAIFSEANGQRISIALVAIERAYQPAKMNLWQKLTHYSSKIAVILLEDPRESNTEGGLFPAILGTLALILTMSILSFPLGVLAGVYLSEYAKDGIFVRLVRIAVNNLASIPAIVFGIFGLGFFVYGIGGWIDQTFFAYKLPEPTFGTGGILWASLTLGMLTIPIVIVATEESLASVPRAIRDNSYALGATKLQTLVRICLPAASPGVLTGFILAMARAAGEVAPLMITGVVKMAPDLLIDGDYPFIHWERKFMHLGFHIYDISFQSPNVEATTPMVYVTALLLISMVICLSALAIFWRERLKRTLKVTGF